MSHLLSEIKQQDEAAAAVLEAKLMYRMVVSGKTFGALMQRVKDQVQNQLQLVERDQDHEITFVCPIGSHYASDVEAAMTDVKGTNTSATDDPIDSNNGPTDGGPQGARGPSTSATGGPMESLNVQTEAGPQGARAKLMYRMVVSGKTFSDLMQRVKDQVQLAERDQDHEITFVCPIGSRYASDVEAAMTDVKGDEWNLIEPEAGPEGATAKLKYRMVLGGKTFDAHLKLMEKVKDQVQNQLQLVERDQDHKITFVFCPICSRVASDVEAVMTDVKDDKPVILVLMHHTREVKYTSSLQTWRDDNKVVLFVNVFYHETIQGLLKCEENNAAVSKIQNELLKRFFPRSKDSRGNPQGVGAGGLTGNTSGRGGGNDRGSDVDSSSSGHSGWFPLGKPSWWPGQ